MVDKMKMALLVDGFNKMFFGEISENTLTRKELNEIDILYDGPGWFDNNLINKIPASNRESDMSSVIYQNI